MMSGKKKIVFIINPISGTRNKENLPELITQTIDLTRYELELIYTEYAGHAEKITHKLVKDKVPFVVAVGGDGTVNEVARALINTKTALAILPFGSGNGLARHLNIPLSIKDAINLLNHSKTVAIDYGTANDHPFFCTCGAGFDARIGHEFAKSEKRGFFSYLKSIMREFFSYRPKKYKLVTTDITIKKKAFIITFANAAQYGNNAFIAPDADIQDGLIDVCLLEPFPFSEVPSLGMRLFSRRINKSRYVRILKTNEVLLKRKKSGEFHIDGEPCMMKKKIKVVSHKQGLLVMVNEKSEFLSL